MMGGGGLLLGFIAGGALRVLVGRLRTPPPEPEPEPEPEPDTRFRVYGISQERLDRLMLLPGCPDDDVHHFADWLANLTGEPIVMQGESLVVAVPDEP